MMSSTGSRYAGRLTAGLALAAMLTAPIHAAAAQRGQPTQATWRSALAKPHRAIVDSALVVLLEAFPLGEAPYFTTAADARRFIRGETGDAGLSTVRIYPLKGPKGERLAIASFTLNDDPSMHGDETGRTLIFDLTGRVIASDAHDLRVQRVSGCRATTTFGTIHWNGRRWVFPKWRGRED